MSDNGRSGSDHLEAIEVWACNYRMSTVKMHRFVPDYSTGSLLVVSENYRYNYPKQRYRCKRRTFDYSVAPDGSVEHDGRRVHKYARERMQLLCEKRGLRDVHMVHYVGDEINRPGDSRNSRPLPLGSEQGDADE